MLWCISAHCSLFTVEYWSWISLFLLYTLCGCTIQSTTMTTTTTSNLERKKTMNISNTSTNCDRVSGKYVRAPIVIVNKVWLMKLYFIFHILKMPNHTLNTATKVWIAVWFFLFSLILSFSNNNKLNDFYLWVFVRVYACISSSCQWNMNSVCI